jgi:signal transduction histidine kinase
VTIKKRDGVVRMAIHDDGRSFHVESALYPAKIKRLGLLGMRERVEMVGGTFFVESARGQGTTIRVDIPFDGVPRRSTAARIEDSK